LVGLNGKTILRFRNLLNASANLIDASAQVDVRIPDVIIVQTLVEPRRATHRHKIAKLLRE
jgi:hypothetical protein